MVRRAAGLAAVGALLAPAVASADPGWIGDPLAVFPRTTAEGTGFTNTGPMGVGMSARGETVALFSATSTALHLNAAIRPPGGTFGAMQQVIDEPYTSYSPVLAVAPDGTAIVVWSTDAPAATRTLRFAVRPPGGAFGPAQDVPGSGRVYGGPKIDVDGGGNAYIGWTRLTDDSSGAFVQVVRRSAGGTFGAVETLSDGHASQAFDLDVNPRGDAIVAWDGGVGTYSAYAAIRRAGDSTFGSADPVGAPAAQIYGEDVQLSPTGDAAITWWQFIDEGGTLRNRLRGSLRPASASAWGPQRTISAIDEAPFPAGNEFDGAFDGSGRFVVVWWRTVGAERHLEFATADAGGTTFGAPSGVPGASTNLSFEPRLLADGAGRVLLAFRDQEPGDAISHMKASFLPSGGVFATAVPIGPPGTTDDSDGRTPFLAGDGRGDGALLYGSSRYHGDPANPPDLVRVAGFDGAGPMLDGLQVPATGVAGNPLPFAVSPLDVWSPVASTRWAFGDGATSDSASTSHVYGAAGTFPASVTATDSRGNATSSAAANVAVSARPVVPPPADITPPKVTGLSLLRSRFRVGSAPTAIVARARARAKQGTAFRFRLDEAATVRIAIARELPGRKVRGRCRAHGSKRARRCTRVVPKGTLRRTLPAGRANVAFSGRIGRKALAPGRYRATLSATDAAGNRRTLKPVRFRVVRR